MKQMVLAALLVMIAININVGSIVPIILLIIAIALMYKELLNIGAVKIGNKTFGRKDIF